MGGLGRIGGGVGVLAIETMANGLMGSLISID